MITARTTDGASIRFEASSLAQGGEKTIFWSHDRKHVVGFFHGTMRDRRERAQRLSKILTKYNPTAAANGSYWEPYFCWPTAVVDGGDGIPERFARDHSLVWPPLGVVAPAYRSSFFFTDNFGNRQEKEVKWFTGKKARKFVPAPEFGSLLTRLQVCTRLARAVRRMHFAGLAHSDLSNKNVLVDLKGGDACVIDIDSLVVPGVAPPTVLGTPGYIAPEVLAGGAQPSIDTDRHALSVLIYQLLLWRHPLQGRKVHSTRSAEEDEQLAMGRGALFVEHPTDRSNQAVEPVRVPFSRLGPYLAPLVQKAFVTGLHAPSMRPDAAEWEAALYRTLNLLHPTPDGRDWMLVVPGEPLSDPFSGQRHARPIPYARYLMPGEPEPRDEKQSLTLFHHLRLHAWHTHYTVRPDELADRAPRGYCAQHQGAYWLVNISDEPWTDLTSNRVVGKNEAVELTSGRRILMGDTEGARILEIRYAAA